MRKNFFWLCLMVVIFLPELFFACTEEKVIKQIPQVEETYPMFYETVDVVHDGEVITMDLEEYITGVVLGEMPATFHDEALKAQAIATRTYTLHSIINAGKHENADICTNASCCQAFISVKEYTGGNKCRERVGRAVQNTKGQVLTYNGQLIEATYFSASGGRTESSAAVWGVDRPYLRAQDSPEDENSKFYRDVAIYSQADFLDKLDIEIGPGQKLQISHPTYTPGGGIQTIRICHQEFTGLQIRKQLGLRSTAFDISLTAEGVVITTKGNGHRVGMSQYGADAMAKAGKAYAEILSYYYPGTQLTQW